MLTLMAAGAYIALLPIIIPFTVWVRFNTWLKRQSPGPPVELTKASMGGGMLFLAGWIVFISWRVGDNLMAIPLVWVPLAIMAAWGLLWLITSGTAVLMYGSQGPTDFVILVKAALTAGVGWVLAEGLSRVMRFSVVLAANPLRAPPDKQFEVLGFLVGMFIAWMIIGWLFATGVTRFVLVLLTKIPRLWGGGPKSNKNPYGEARPATFREAQQAMRGGGGVPTSLDNQDF
jgi:hypothetical protein